MPPGSGVPVPGATGGIEDVDVDGQEDRAVPHGAHRPLDDLADAELADVVHEERRDALLALPAELDLARPVAAEPDLRVATWIDVAVANEAVHRRPVRDLDAEHLRAGVRVRVEVDEPDRAVARGDGPDVRLGDRVVSSEDRRGSTRRRRPARR